MLKHFGVDDRVVFLGPVRHVRNVLSITDVAVLPTFYDPASRFILEAIAAGTPVITTRFNGAVDAFEDGRHGRIVDSPLDVEALAGAIGHFCDPASIRSASEAIRADNLAERISIDTCAGRLEALYERITALNRSEKNR
jgi:UDP-glucose:(heptosyl)LPS alpha-1,3-glucosyltransferase